MSDSRSTIDDGDIAGLPRVLLAALEHTRSATCITTADLDRPGPTIVYVNPAYCLMTGRDRADVIGRTPRLMQGPLTDRAVLDRLRTDLSSGRRFAGETVNYRADGSPFIINWSIDPVRDDEGIVSHFVATQEDVTERVRLARLVAAETALDEALTEVLTASIDETTALERTASLIAAGAADIATVGAVVATIDDVERSMSVASGTRDGSGHADTFRFERPASLSRVTIEIDGQSTDQAAFLDRDGLERFVVHAGGVAAALTEYQRQRRTAIRLQRALLPSASLSAPGWEIACRYVPGAVGLHVGGDWYDVAVTPSRIVCSVGDVSGSGVDAAALMGRLRVVAALEFDRGAPIPEVVELLDRLCSEEYQFATLLAVEIERLGDGIRVWSAGHPPPVVFGTGGARVAGPLHPSPPLGHLRGASPAAAQLVVDDGLLIYTDGLVERRREPVTDGIARLVAGVDPSAALDGIVDAALGARDVADADDVAILALRRAP